MLLHLPNLSYALTKANLRCCHLCCAGQAVFGQVAGSLASHVVADSQLLVPMPPVVTFEQAATTPTVFTTADMAFNHAMDMMPGTHALVHATAGMGGCLQVCRLLQTLEVQ